jgi:hypothetical protein
MREGIAYAKRNLALGELVRRLVRRRRAPPIFQLQR